MVKIYANMGLKRLVHVLVVIAASLGLISTTFGTKLKLRTLNENE